ncbi:probable purine permease 11 [Phoenix dactylifera]|uniref:Probable purine permease n=1 Tax=Phoenix dactylifera TaxID=42345 RepID=A0A8B8J0H1_PHODC|nr:probable purine permease 11 [Phoenix dactylifera]
MSNHELSSSHHSISALLSHRSIICSLNILYLGFTCKLHTGKLLQEIVQKQKLLQELCPHQTNLASADLSFLRPTPSLARITLIYFSLGLMMACDDLMYSYGLSYLLVSTFSLICATQLAFHAISSYFLNWQKFTDLILNSVVLLTFSAALLVVSSNSKYSDESEHNYALGFVLTMGASATFSLVLSLMQLTFQKVQKRKTFAVVLEMQIYGNTVVACVSVVGLLASGEWRSLKGEMEVYGSRRVSYVMTLVWIAVSWQVASVATVGLIFVVSSLFSNVISTLSLPVVPIFAVIFFHDKLDGVKVVAMLIV